MAVSLTETIHKLGSSILERCRDARNDLGQQLCAMLEPLLSPDFRIGFVGVRDASGEVLIERALLIYTASLAERENSTQYVAPETVAGVLHVTQSLNESSLAKGYALIGKVKALQGHDTDSVEGWHHVPVGMIVACDCDRPIEQLVDVMANLNASIPSTRWVDAVSVLSRGMINYAVQFEGGKIGGDFILPNKTGAMQFAMYVHVMVTSPKTYTFNRTCGFLFMHLGCFSRKTALPTNQMVMEGASRIAVNVRAYMFDATDHLVPVPEETKADIDAFEKPYELVLMSSMTVRDLSREIGELFIEHQSKIARGVGVRIDGRTVHIDEPIDKELRRLVESFLNSSNRVMLTGMKEVAKALHLDIGFFFKKESTFLNGIAALDGSGSDLASYCRRARVWSDMLNTVRNEMEHNFWMVPRVQYRIEQGRVVVLEPEIMGRSASDFTKFVTDRMLCFIEEISVHGLQYRMPVGVSVTEIPLRQRPTIRAERFRLCTTGGGMPLWKITYHETSFDET